MCSFIKFRYSEKVTKFWKQNPNLSWRYLVIKKSGRFFQIFCPSRNIWTLIIGDLLYAMWAMGISKSRVIHYCNALIINIVNNNKWITFFRSPFMMLIIFEVSLGSGLAKFAITSIHAVKNMNPKLRIPTHITILSFILKMKCIMFLCLQPVQILLIKWVIIPSECKWIYNKMWRIWYSFIRTVHISESLIMKVKGQEISEVDYGVFNFPKKQLKNFTNFLASKKWSNQKADARQRYTYL